MEAQSNTFSAIPEALQKVLQNPEFLQNVKNVIRQLPTDQGLGAEAQETTKESEEAPTFSAPETEEKKTDGDVMASLLQNPKMMEQLPQIASALKTALEKNGENPPSEGALTQKNRNALLLAVKPFLTAERQSAVDAMIRISALGNLLKDIR